MAFLVICVGITILQMSKVDPTELKSLDRRSTILLQAARQQTEAFEEKSASGLEDPGIDTLRGSFGTVGSIIRARTARRISQSSRLSAHSSRFGVSTSQLDLERAGSKNTPPVPSNFGHYGAMKRHQLFDPPVPSSDAAEFDTISMSSQPSARKPAAIKFGEEDMVHSYHRTTAGKDDLATHERRVVPRGTSPLASPPSFIPSRSSPPGNSTEGPMDQRQSPESPKAPHSRFDSGPNGLRSAPPRVGISNDAYHDPFGNSPATVTLPSFPSGISLDEFVEPRRQPHRRQSSSRDYPKGHKSEDAEERVSLWDPRRNSSNSEDMDLGAPSESPPETIRLVSASRGGQI
jgi:magnesium transporter